MFFRRVYDQNLTQYIIQNTTSASLCHFTPIYSHIQTIESNQTADSSADVILINTSGDGEVGPTGEGESLYKRERRPHSL